jgi:hypothetical protein
MEWTHDKIRAILGGMALSYWCMSDEQGLEGHTPHTHVYFAATTSAIRFSTIKGLFPTAHIEPAQGTSAECRSYIEKSGKWAEDEKADTSITGTFEEWGATPEEHPGQRSDFGIALEMLEDGATVTEIIRHSPGMIRYRSHLEQTRQELLAEEYRNRWRTLETTYIWGSAGAGKTRSIMDTYGYSAVYAITDYEHPFDRYMGENVILFDEFMSSLPIRNMNIFLDGYPLTLPARYANRQACYEHVFIISNVDLPKQYEKIQEEHPEVWKAFLRRIHKIIRFFPTGERKEYETTTYMTGTAKELARKHPLKPQIKGGGESGKK